PVEDLAAFDRAAQAAAVEAIARDAEFDVGELVELWRSTARYDVRAHIAQALGRLGPRGAGALLELSRERRSGLHGGELIIDALAAGGPEGLAAALAECERPGYHMVAILPQLLERFELDPALYARRLLASDAPASRIIALHALVKSLPAGERSR